MNRKPARRSSLFLLELMTAILFFCLCAGYCVRMFAHAYTVGTDSGVLTYAVRQCRNVTELFRGTEDFHAVCSREYPQGVWEEDTVFVIFYDGDWNLCAEEDARYTVQASLSQEDVPDKAPEGSGGLLECTAAAFDSSGNEIYSIPSASYQKGGVLH